MSGVNSRRRNYQALVLGQLTRFDRTGGAISRIKAEKDAIAISHNQQIAINTLLAQAAAARTRTQQSRRHVCETRPLVI